MHSDTETGNIERFYLSESVFLFSSLNVMQKVIYVCVFVFLGELCEEKLDFCAPELNPCQHDSKCILTPQGYK